jgi:hypothetical protein
MLATMALACGGETGESKQETAVPSAVGAAPEKARQLGEKAVGGIANATRAATPGTVDAARTMPVEPRNASDPPEVQTCLQTVASGEFARAVPVCTAALAASPGNQSVQQALETAKHASVGTAASAVAPGLPAAAGTGAAAGDAARQIGSVKDLGKLGK